MATDRATLIHSSLCDTLDIQYPIILAGMAVVASAPLASAVSNAGGLGVIGAGFPEPSPKLLRKMINELQETLHDKRNFGVDLLVPQVGGNARKTNYDYTKGQLSEMIDVICESRCKLFVSAVGVPPKWIVDKLHAAGTHVMSMIGSPRHVKGCLDAGVDIICAQGYEGGGHTGEVGTMALIPQVVDRVQGAMSPLSGKAVQVVAAGGMYDGRTLCAALSLGAQGVWMGTRFLAAKEATTTKISQEKLLIAEAEDTIRSVIYTGRPARVYKTGYVVDWEKNRQNEIKDLTDRGILPYLHDMREAEKRGEPLKFTDTMAISFGQCVGGIKEIKPAAEIIEELMHQAIEVLQSSSARLTSKL